MKKTRLVAALAAGCLVFVVLRAREPRYQGRTLTEWICTAAAKAKDKWFTKVASTKRKILASYPVGDPDWETASEAVKAMAPTAIPILLQWASAKDSRQVIIKTKEALNRFFGWHLDTRPTMAPNIKAYLGFQLLGTNASPAWPVLIQRTSSTDPHLRQTSIVCLDVSGAPGEILRPILQRLEQDPDPMTATVAGVLDRERFQRDAGVDPIQ